MRRFNSFAIFLEQPVEARALFYAVFFFRCSTIAFPFYGAFLLAQEAMSPTDVAIVVGAFGVGALLADLAASAALKHLRSDLVIKLSVALLATIMLAVGHYQTFWPLLFLTFLWGFCYETVTPASYAMISDLYTGAENKLAFACNRLAINLGMAVGPSIGGLVYSYGTASIFWINSLALALTAAFMFIRVGQVHHAAMEDAKVEELSSSDDPHLGSELRFWFAFLMVIPLHLAFALPPTMIGVLVIDTLLKSSVWVSAVFLLNALLVVFVELPINKHFLSLRYSTVLLWGFVMSGLGFMMMGMIGWPILLLVATCLWTFGEMIIFPTILGYINSISPQPKVKRNLGLYSAGVNVGILIAPPSALALNAISGGLPWLIAGGGLICSAALLVVGRNVSSLWLEGDAH